MLVSEDQAKTKWCPDARTATAPGFGAINRPPADAVLTTRCNCIGSQCMAWRWGQNLEGGFVNCYQEEIADWKENHPEPELPKRDHAFYDDAMREYEKDYTEWRDLLLQLMQSFPVPPNPPGDTSRKYTWIAEFDEEACRPVCGWQYGALYRGYCGRAGVP